MIIERLALRGIARFTAELLLDLRDLPSGLVAIVGENGEGKTFLLETPLATLHRSWPSRTKKKDHQNLADYATERDSYVELDFTMDGRGTFRARVNVDGMKGGSDAVLQEVHGPHRIPVNDGKVTTYDDAVAERFPPPAVMLASTFSAQNRRGNFITAKESERKDLFSHFLGHDHYEPISATAGQAWKLIEQTRGRLDAVRARLEHETRAELLDALDARAKALQKEGGDAEVFAADSDQQIAVLEARLSMVADQAAAHQSAALRVQTLTNERDTRARELSALIEKACGLDRTRDAEQQSVKTRAVAARLALEGTVTTLKKTSKADMQRVLQKYADLRTDLNARIRNNRDALADAAEINAAVEKVTALTASLAERRVLLDDRQRQHTETSQRRFVIERDIAALEQKRSDLSRAQADAAVMTTVPCGGAGDFVGCKFLTNAAAAKAHIETLTAAIAPLEDWRKESERLAVLLVGMDTAITELCAAIAQDYVVLQLAQTTAARVERLKVAEARIADLDAQVAKAAVDEREDLAALQKTADDRGRELGLAARTIDDDERRDLAAAEARWQTSRDDLDAQTAGVTVVRDRLQADLTTAEADMRASADTAQQAVMIQDDLSTSRRRQQDARITVARVQTEAGQLQRQREDLAAKRAELDVYAAKVHGLDTDIIQYQQIAKAFGRDGLRTLEIDEAGPTVSSYANDLMAACDMGRFTIELVTQDLKADGKGLKESFTIKVFDNVRGGEPRDISDLSGGEQVIISEALMNAIAIYVNQRSDTPIRTCWRDETTGALDPENATRYLQMLRKVQQLGGFHHVFFITHNLDAAALADAQIRVGGGTAAIALPPFERAA